MYETLTLPQVKNRQFIENLDVGRRYIIDPTGNNIHIAHSKYTDIRRDFEKAIKNGQNKNRIVLNKKLNRDGRFILKSINYCGGKFIMIVIDVEKDREFVYEFAKDMKMQYSKSYYTSSKKYSIENSFTRKKKSEEYQNERKNDYQNARYAWESKKDIERIFRYIEKYNAPRAFRKEILDYEHKQKTLTEVHVDNKSVTVINKNLLPHIQRLAPDFQNISDEPTLMAILKDYKKMGYMKNKLDKTEGEKMLKEISELINKASELTSKASEMKEALAFFS